MYSTVAVPEAWAALVPELVPEWATLRTYLDQRVADDCVVYPGPGLVFRALELVPPQHVRVILCGQDPFHNGSAEGLCFSVPDGHAVNPSLRNVLEAVAHQTNTPRARTSSLVPWAEQGVLLINSALTVVQGRAGSHLARWERFSQLLFGALRRLPQPAVWLLWGQVAQNQAQPVAPHHLALSSPHPSPLAGRRFQDHEAQQRSFLATNAWLERQGLAAIQWVLP